VCISNDWEFDSCFDGPPKPRLMNTAVLHMALSRAVWMKALCEWLENLSSDVPSLGRDWSPSVMFPVSLHGIRTRSEDASEAALISVSAKDDCGTIDKLPDAETLLS